MIWNKKAREEFLLLFYYLKYAVKNIILVLKKKLTFDIIKKIFEIFLEGNWL